MRKYRIRKRNFYILLIVLFVLSIGLGYSALTQRLNIDNTVSYDAMKWDVGFVNPNPVQWVENSILPSVSISEDKKTIYIDCDFGSSTSSKECTTTVGVANLSTFNVELSADPNVEFDSLLIKEVEVKWVSDGEPNSVEEDVAGGFVLEQNITKELVIRILSNDLTVEMLPSTELVIPISISFDWHQTDK